jgi:ABC-type enterobactin transport system permease subunit
MIFALLIGPGQHGNWTVTLDPDTLLLYQQQPVAVLVPAIIGGLCSLASAFLLWRGTRRRHLHLAIIGIWLALVGQMLLAFIWHCLRLWQAGITIYDQGIWLNQIMSLSGLAMIISIYLLLSKHLRARFPKPSADIAAIF